MNKLTKKNIEDIYALTPMQQGMLFHYLKDPDGENYFEQLILHIGGKIDVEIFKKAWKKVVEINEILRTVFRWENLEQPIQIILKKYEPKISFMDFFNENTCQKKNKTEEIKRKDREEKFHLEEVPFRVTLCKIEENRYDMVVSNHHILYDGWSNGIILKEFFNTYADISNGKKTTVPRKTKFKKFVRWTNNQDTDKQEVFWSEYLKDFAAANTEKDSGNFRTKRSKNINCAGNYQAILAAEIKGRLDDFVKKNNITLAPVLYSAWGILLLLLHQGDRVLFETTVSGRTKEIKGIEDMVGLFINTLPLGIKTRGDQNLLALVSGVSQSLQKWEKFENTSQVIVKEYLEKCHRESFFDALVVLENYPLEKQLLRTTGELIVDSFSITGGAHYDITLIITIFDEIKFCFTYNEELFDEETTAALSCCFVAVINEIVTNSFKTLPGIHQLLTKEREKILNNLKISRQPRPYPDEIEYTAPRNELEEKVAEIWSEVLSIDKSKIGIDADFFAFGGHSLKASMLASLMYQELHVKVPLSEIFHRPTIRELVEYIKGTGESRYARFPGAETKEYYPLSSAQRRFYMLQQLDMRSIAYNAYLFMMLEGKIHRDKLETTFSRLIRRHESLRTAFIYHRGEPWQKVLPEVNFSLNYFEINNEESKKIISDFIRPFDLSRAPLMRVGLIKLDDENETYILLFDMHHIISDGSSVNILVKEFMELYQGIRVPLQKYQYKDFSEWQNNQLKTGKLKPQEKFWLDRFSGEIPVLDMPCDYPRPAIRSFEGERRIFNLNEILVKWLSDLTRKTGTTLYMVLLAGLGILLNKYAGARDIIIGTPIAGRDHKDLMNIFGLFVEMIVLRIYPEDRKSFTGYLKEIKDLTLASFDNQAYPFGELIRRLSLQDDLSRNPLFDIMLIVQNQGRLELEIDDLKISPLEFENHTSKVDINIEVFELQEEKEKGIRVELEYCTKLFKRETMERFFRHFQVILNQVTNNPDLKVGEIDIVTEEEKKQILKLFNDTNTGVALVEGGGSWLLDDLFKTRVEQIPDRIALVGPKLQNTNYKKKCNISISITYGELENQSNRLGRLLCEKGVGPGTIVGIMGERSIDTVIGIWGILKAGGAYLPIDPAYPRERIDYMLKDSGAQVLIKDNDIVLQANNNRSRGTPSCQHLLPTPATSLAYVMYTSGTTGKPKGVLVEQESVVNVVNWFAVTFGVDRGTHLLQLTDYTFDPSVEDIFATLLHGGVLFIADKELVFYRERFSDFVQRHEVQIINYVPLVLNKLLGEGEKLKSVRVVISGGEKLDENVKDRIIGKGYRLYNNYGPTEVTVDALSGLCTGEKVTLGKPIFNVACYIMDNRGCFVPVGVVGELWISGAGVARGYLNRPELTTEKLLRGGLNRSVSGSVGQLDYKQAQLGNPLIMMPRPHPETNENQHHRFAQHIGSPRRGAPGRRRQKTYKTGDLARWLSDGNIEFLGRLDRQVKIRGYRVELGEIEKELSAYEGIKEATAVPLGNSIICAYFTSSVEKNVRELRYFLSQKLPDYMIPAYFIRLDEMPLTASGKINIPALPDPREIGIDTGVEYVPPGSESEEQLAKIWQKILGIERIGIEDNFFELGGDSIRMIQCIVRIREEMKREVSLKNFFVNSTIKSLSAVIAGKSTGDKSIPSIVPVSRDRKIPLSFPQERVWFLQNLYEGYMSYHVPRVIRIKGDLDISLLERTFSEIIRRHEILRTVFPVVDNQPVQKILDPFPVRIPVWDWSDLDAGQQETKINAFLMEEGQKGFDLEHGPMMRLSLLKLKPAEQVLVLVEHHLVHDGWTQGVMLREFIQIYRAYSQGKPSPLAELSIQYADFAVWQKDYMQGERLERHLYYWKRKLAGLPLLLELPTDHPRPPVISGRGDVKRLRLSRQLSTGLRKFSKNHDVTLFMTMLAVLKVLLYRYTGTEDLCVGAGIANRQCREMESMLGMVINSLPLRTLIHPGWSFRDLLEQVKETCHEAYEHEDTPLEKIVEALRPVRSLSYTPLFQVMFTFLDTPTEALSLPGLELNLEEFHNRSSKFDLNIVVILLHDEAGNRENQEMVIEWEYSTDIFAEPTMQRMLSHYHRLLDVVVNRVQAKGRIANLPIMENSELKQLLYEWNDTAREYPGDKTVHQLFADQAKQIPHRIAVMHNNTSITYEELNRESDRLAYLLKEKDIGADNIVGIMVERSIEMINGILGILKSGGAYLPIDPDYPDERTVYILNDANVSTLLVEKHKTDPTKRLLQGGYSGDITAVDGNVVSISSDKDVGVDTSYKSNNLAYIIYTSGSTGNPKGVPIEHRSVVNRLFWMQRAYPLDAGDVIIQKTTYTFDVSVWELFWWSFYGAMLALLAPGEEKDPGAIADAVQEYRVTTMHFVPSMLNAFLGYLESADVPLMKLKSLRRVFASGEALGTAQVRQFYRLFGRAGSCRLINLYGPTEATVDVSYFDCPDSEAIDRVPIGKPIDNICLYIVDRELCPQPVGVVGQLCIAGVGLARGYLNKPDLTADKFVTAEAFSQQPRHIPGSPRGVAPTMGLTDNYKLYQTGDLARWLLDGNIEFLGRIDHQVKIRGFRIELGEIENRLSNHPAIKEAIVSVREKEGLDKYLCAYIVSNKEIYISELREYLAAHLPGYMIPSFFVNLDKIPVTANGKIDRNALPEPEGINPGGGAAYTPPTNPVEKKLVEIWGKVLGRKNIGINENFFLVGGDSIKSIQIISRMSIEGYKMEMNDLFQYPRISDLAPRIKKSKRIPDQSVIEGAIPLTPIQEAFFNESHSTPHHYNQTVMLYSKEGFDKKIIETVFTRLQEHHDALRNTYNRDSNRGELIQIGHGLEYPLSLREFDLKNHENYLEELNTKINEIQASIDLEKGPLMKLGLFYLNDGDRLLIVIHHLVIDGVSWRILFEDIETLYGQYKRGEKLALTSKTDSFKLWSEKLSAYADSKIFLKEKKYWQKIESLEAPPIPRDFEEDDNYIKDTRSESFTPGEEQTGLLLTKVNKAFRTEINDILLTALGISIKKTFGQDRVLVALEGHGREDIMEDMDIGRTTGWFTSLYPVLLDISHAGDPGRQIKEIKETLRRIPNKGIGYGILKYLTGEENKKDIQFKLKPQIIFNYLGQFDADVKQLSSFEMAKESTGNWQSLNNRREYLLDVSGITTNNRLTMTISFNKTHFKPGTIAALVENFESELTRIIGFCCAKENIERTPSDFTYKGLSIEKNHRLMKEYPGIEDIYTLTPMQEGMLFHALVDDSSYSYFQQASYRLQGQLDIYLVEKSLNELFKRHDILRTAFVYKDIESPLQLVLKDRVNDFYYEDISELKEREEKENLINEFKKRDKNRSFDLSKSKGTLMRVSIHRLEEAEYEFTWSFHHILMDGWCLGIINHEFFEIYTGYLENRPYRLPGVKPYRRYIQWLEKQDKEESARYWENYLDSFEDRTGVPRTRILTKEENRYRNETLSVILDMEKTAGLNRVAALNHVTLNTVTQTLWGILLGKYNGKGDVVFGAVVSGRPFELEGVESMVGLFINTIPVRIRFEEPMKLNTLFRKTQAEALASEPHHYHPLAEIQAGTTLKQNLIDHIVIFENYPIAEQIKGYGREKNKSSQFTLKITNVDVFEQTNYDFNVSLSGSDQLTITFQYNSNVYDRDFVERIARHFCLEVDQVIENQELEVQEMTLLSEEEKSRLLYEFNNTGVDYPEEKTIHLLFEEQVDRFPDHGALVFDDQTVTFRDFAGRANRLANYLHQEKEVQPDDRVAVLMDRSIELIIVLMAVMKARAAYVPMDVSQPGQRLRLVLDDASIGIVISQQKYLPKLTNVQTVCKKHHTVLCIEDLENDSNNHSTRRPPTGNAQDPAYVMYTSGSSGIPKGVLVEHRSIVNTITWRKNNYEYAPGHASLQIPPYFFDSSVTDIFTPLLGGARLVLVRDEERSDMTALRRIITINFVSHFIVVPVFYNVMLEEMGDDLKYLKMVCCAGDFFPDELIKKHFERLPRVRIFNEYGPTENSVNTTAYELEPHSPRALIGKPISNVRVYILDRNLSLCPIGVTGELCLAGSSLTRGYLNHPEMTDQKFCLLGPARPGGSFEKSPPGPPQNFLFDRVYRSGDLGRGLIDGNLEFLGRADNQVKIRGIRVEIGEIENQLMKYEQIKEAVVRIRQDENGTDCLCAYLVPHSQRQDSIKHGDLKEYLSQRLPDYMVPAYIREMEQLPLTPNGKLDVKALPIPRFRTDPGDQYQNPRNHIEKKLVEIWKNVLGKDNISTHDNFFYMGGDSIKSIQIMSRMNRAGYKLEMKDIFQYPVISELAPHVKKLRRTPDQAPVTGEIPLTPIQAAFFNSSPIDPHHFNQAVMFYSAVRLDKEIIEKVFARIQEHHDALRMTYQIDSEIGEVLQFNQGSNFPLFLHEYDLNSPAELEEKINRIQESINLEKGPLMKIGLFHLDDGDRLLIVIHHLVIDGISWRILFEDIEMLYGQYQRGEKPALPPKTDAFKLWSEKLQDYAHNKTFLKEKHYWTRLEKESAPPIKKDFPAEENAVKDTRSVSFSLAEAETALLLDKVNRCYRTEINDILLTALAMALKKTFGEDRLLLALEGHGREQIFEDMDTSRTIGWFTTEYPVLIDVSYADDTGRQIKEIKETLRQIPNKGIGSGILKYLNGDINKKEMEFKLKPQIIFNYLGQFDAEIKQISSFEIAEESTGNSRSLRNQREYELEINGMIANNRLSMTISYNETHFKPGTMASLTGHFQSWLEHIIAFCAAKETIEPTPSDFTYKGLSITRLHGLMETYPDIEDIYTLSPMQEGMLFHALVDEASASYFEQTSFRLQGELDIGLVEKSLNQLVKRHDILRTAFVHKDTMRPVQVLLKNRPVDFYYQDIIHIINREEQKTFVREFKADDKKNSFDLSNDILVRASILRLDRGSYEFTWSFHHILMDGWCIGILINEFFEIYSSYVDNRPHRLPQAKPYRTYIQWLEKLDKEESGLYWGNYLDCFEEPTGIPGKKPERRVNQSGYSNKKVSFQLDGDKTRMLNQLAARYHVTQNIVNQTIWGILLGKYNGKEDVVFGAVVSGRPFELEGVESMVGLFINTIPVRIRYQGKTRFHQLLQKVQAEAIAAEPYHYHPLADIQSRSPLKQNLMDHLFVFENYPIAEQIQGYGNRKNKASSFQLTDVDVFEQTNYDFNILLAGTDQLKITFQYNANAVDNACVEQVAHHYQLVLNQVIENEELEIEALTLLTPVEKNRLLYEFNETAAEYSLDKTIHQLFLEQVAQRPHQVALVAQDQDPGRKVQSIERDKERHAPCAMYCAFTYRELNKKSLQLAYLLAQNGVEADDIVGIMMERSIEVIIGILGILKAGGAYLPIDPGYPGERIEYMMADSSARILVTCSSLEQKAQEMKNNPRIVFIDCFDVAVSSFSHLLNFSTSHSTNLAYVIYTSGSTGKPKGVMVKHRSAVNILSALHREYPLGEQDTYLLKTSYTFDVSVAELFGWFLGGGRLAILEPGGEKDPRRILETIAMEYITHINFVPSMFNFFVEILNHRNIDRITSLRYIFLAGETLLPAMVKRFKALDTKIILENIYGPTEGTIYASRYSLRDWNGRSGIPIGKPMANIKLYLPGKDSHLHPVGIAGELCIAGVGLARGYLNRPELTSEKFVKWETGAGNRCRLENKTNEKFLRGGPGGAVFSKSAPPGRRRQKIYKTGDRARWMPDGNVEFLGRMDFQVKIRGFRVELGEIENRLNAHPRIKEAVVIDRKDRERKYLCAYFTTDVPIDVRGQTSPQEILSVRQLKEYLEGKLPEYMVPSCFVRLDRIPLKANGKIDRPKLPPPLDSDIQVSSIYQAPVTDMQGTIAEIWQEVLGREKIGINDNFFDLGGNSLDLVVVSNKLREKLNKEVPVAALFTHSHIETLASYLTAVELPGTSVTVPGNFVMLNGSPQSIGNIFLIHEVLGDVGAYMEFSKQLGTRYNCWGVEAEKLKNYAPQNVTIEQISAKYIRQMKTIQPHGPYNLATWSWGGHLGLEMALQLEKMGEKISFLAFFDCSGPDYKKNNRLPQFTLETERVFLRKFFTITGNQVELEKMSDIEQLWISAVEALTGDAALVEELRQLLIKNALALPDYDELSGEELVQYLNLDRIHAAASSRYIPVGKIHTPIHYFWANQNRERVESWKDYCHNPVVYHEINGDHHSIFRNKEQITEFARLFRDLIYHK